MIGIAVVEDNSSFREALDQIIHDMPGTVLKGSFASPFQALQHLPVLKPDVVIADISMPEMTGIELIRMVKPLLPSSQFLVCTVHDDNETVFESLRAGATGYLLKDAAAKEIQQAIIEVHHGGSPMSPYIARKVIGFFQHQPPVTGKSSYDLSGREKEVLDLISKGLQYKEIAAALDISMETVKKHLRNIYNKMQVSNRIEAINKYRTQ
ncbi:MAG: response regulator transcription factor [Chitinophagaceae bacterium]|nr:response regulator transcription factor [Chitinophagaceae bacterium]